MLSSLAFACVFAIFTLLVVMGLFVVLLGMPRWLGVRRLNEFPGGGAAAEQEDRCKRRDGPHQQDSADDVVAGTLEDSVPIEGRPPGVAHGEASDGAGAAEKDGARLSMRLITASVGPSRLASCQPR